MLSKTQSKYIRSLTQQKYRKEHGAFIAEGDKIAKEWLISDTAVEIVVGTGDWLEENQEIISKHSEATIIEVLPHELEKVSSLKTPNKVLLVAKIPVKENKLPQDGWVLALDTIQDPGNMGTIIRIADWFGIKDIVCSQDCVDVYNPKVVQSAMGGHLRVQLHSTDLLSYIQTTSLPVFAASLNGENIYELPKQDKGIILIGNESQGLTDDLLNAATQNVTIPRTGGAESLNAAVSAGILTALLTQR